MAATPRNFPPGLLPMAIPYETLPADPATGTTITHTDSRLVLTWTGAAWSCQTSGVACYPNPGSLSVRRSVTYFGGALVLTDPERHDRSDGVVLAILSDDWIAVAQVATVAGFSGLTPQARLYVATGGDGTLTEEPDDRYEIIPVGAALTATTVAVRVGFGVGLG